MADVLALEKYLQSIAKEGICLAYSGGIDSTLLLALLRNLQRQFLFKMAVCYCRSELQTQIDYENALLGVRELGLEAQLIILDLKVLDISQVKNNSRERCYFCKKEFFSKIRDKAESLSLRHVLDGSNLDDSKAFRPGRKALAEFGVISPFEKFGFSKKDILLMAESFSLKVIPANSCLATRFPYDFPLQCYELERVAQGEKFLSELGFFSSRLRCHGDIVRIEILPQYFNLLIKQRKKIIRLLKELGFNYITLDLESFRSGSFDIV